MTGIDGQATTSPQWLVAIDDGHSETKVAHFSEGHSGPIVETAFASKVIRGVDMVSSKTGRPGAFYLCGNGPFDIHTTERFTLLDRSSSIRVNNRFRAFPTSPQNRVLVYEALNGVRQLDGPVEIGTTLPYADFHLPDGSHNRSLIDSKKDSIRQIAFRTNPETGEGIEPPFQIASHGIYSEGLMAFYDVLLDYRDGAIEINEPFLRRFSNATRPFAVIDIGGKTTDIVIGSWNGDIATPIDINVMASMSHPAGVLAATDQLEARLKMAFDSPVIGDLDGALSTGRAFLFGQEIDVTEHRDRALDDLAARLIDVIRTKTDDAATFACIVLCGGGALLMPQIARIYPPQLVLRTERPQFANARGILKFMKLAANG